MRVLIFSFLLFFNSSFASFDMNERMEKTYEHIINLRFEFANTLLELEEIENNQNRIIALHKNYIDFLKLLISEDEEYYNISKNKKKERIAFIQKGNKESPYYLYAQGEIYLQWSFIYLKNKEYTSFVYDFIRSYNLFDANAKKFPKFALNKKGLSIIYTLLGAVPKQYEWMLDLIGMKGDIKTGLLNMEQVLHNNELKIYQQEVLFIIAFLQLNLTNDDQINHKYLSIIGDRYKSNILLNFAAARLSHSLGMNEYCIEILENRPQEKGIYPFYYLDYLQGISYLYKLDYYTSKLYFERFIKYFEGENYIKSAYHKLACIAYLEDNKGYKTYFESVIKEGNSFIDEDKVSLKYAKIGDLGSPLLLKARLLYDGGYYQQALDVISEFKVRDNAEYYYRLASIQEKLNYTNEDVIFNYKQAYNLAFASDDYYAPMSSLRIALLYEYQLDFKKADSYFNKCLSFSDFDYQRGIHQQAKAGLERVN